MAEVRMTVLNKNTISYKDDVMLTTASITPPSMTYIDPVDTQVTAKPPMVAMSYLDGEVVEIHGSTSRNITNDVELESTLYREVDSRDPFSVEITANTVRNITNTVVLESELHRKITSYNVRLYSNARRVVTTDVTLEGNLERDCKLELKLEGLLQRNIISDDEVPDTVPKKEYGSFVNKEKLFRVQHDVLDEDVSDNPYFNKDIASNLENSVLLTRNQTVIKAINEIFVNQRDLFFSSVNSAKKFTDLIGDTVLDQDLNDKYKALGVTSIIDALDKLHNGIISIESLIGYTNTDDDETKTILEYLQELEQKIKDLAIEWEDIRTNDIEWIFRTAQSIPALEDSINALLADMNARIIEFQDNVTRRFVTFAQETDERINTNYNGLIEKINNLTERVDEIDNLRKKLSRKLNLLAKQIVIAFRQFTNITEADIRAIFGMLEDIDDIDDPGTIAGDAYQRLVEYIDEKVAEINNTVSGIDNRVSTLETKFDTVFTIDDIATEEDIEALFDGIYYEGRPLTLTDLEDLTVTEEEINELFTITLPDGTRVTIQELLDMVASESDIRDLFADESPTSSGMSALLHDIAVASQGTSSEPSDDP